MSLYLNRSKELEDLNYYEYVGCVGVRSGKPKETDNPNNLHIQKHFHLLPSCAVRNDCYHVLLQKQHTPLFVGRPPKHPGEPPEPTGNPSTAYVQWKKEANSFARYYLTLFRPHRIHDCHNSSAWEALLAWIQELQDDSSIISKFRLMVLHQHVRGLSTLPSSKKMI